MRADGKPGMSDEEVRSLTKLFAPQSDPFVILVTLFVKVMVVERKITD